MIKANNKYWARLVFNYYIENLLKKKFSHFYSVDKIEFPNSQSSFVLTPNHFSWWDGFFADFVLRKETNHNLKIMMLEDQLKKYWFFKYLGAFSIDLEKKISIKESIQYSQKLLNDVGNALVIYPQGKYEPYDKNPLEVKEGIKLIVNNNPTTLIYPLAFKIEFSEEQKPFIAFRIAAPITSKKVIEDFDGYINCFTENLEQLNSAVKNKEFHKDYFLK